MEPNKGKQAQAQPKADAETAAPVANTTMKVEVRQEGSRKVRVETYPDGTVVKSF